MECPVKCPVYNGDSMTGSQRIKSGFLYFPKCIKGKWRWLRHDKWIEMYQIFRSYYLEGGIYCHIHYKWIAIEWADK